MTGFLLDTNVLSEFKRRGAPDPQVTSWLRATDPDLLWASVLSSGEIRKGIERLAPGRRRAVLEKWLDVDLDRWFEERLIPVSKAIADRWGMLTAAGLKKGSQLSSVDGLIAATASVHELTVVTRNVKDFESLGVAIVNPWKG